MAELSEEEALAAVAAAEEVEAERNSMAQEAVIAFFVLSALSDDSESEDSLSRAVETWLLRAGIRLWRIYGRGVDDLYQRLGQPQAARARDTIAQLRDGLFDRDLRQGATPDAALEELGSLGGLEMTPSKRTIKAITTLVKKLRRRLREIEGMRGRGEQVPGGILTPENAGLILANEAVGELTEQIALDLQEVVPEGKLVFKTWITRQDNRVRPLHAMLNFRTVQMGSDFWRWPLTGERLAYPGDIRAPIDATANCRCFMVLTMT